MRAPEKENAPVAQLDRASDYGSEGLGFESLRACFLIPEAFGLRKCRSCSTYPAFFDSNPLHGEQQIAFTMHGGVPVSTEHSRRRLHVEVDRLASLKAAQKIKCLF